MPARELKKYAIRPTYRPVRHPCLSSTVQVIGEGGEYGYCYIAFADALAEAVGAKLTRGIAAFDPAFLHVSYDAVRRVWVVAARYLRTSGHAVLWETPQRPAWLKLFKNKRAHHGIDQAPADRAEHTGDAGTTIRESRARPARPDPDQTQSNPRTAAEHAAERATEHAAC